MSYFLVPLSERNILFYKKPKIAFVLGELIPLNDYLGGKKKGSLSSIARKKNNLSFYKSLLFRHLTYCTYETVSTNLFLFFVFASL